MGILTTCLAKLRVARHATGRLTRLIVVLGACVPMAVSNAQAESLEVREYQIKAAFLYNFLRFVDWPAQALPESADALTICVLGDVPFSESLETIKDKPVKGKRLAVRRIAGAGESGACQVLFIASSEEKRLPQIMPSVQRSGVLTVGETNDFARQGGIINFVVVNNKLRFEINPESAARAGLKLSSQLLSLAKVVR